ncbi:HAD-IIB family hydrolase [Actinomyces vulturis]|uniref:HAD-IIB family hydrolase n=1 Tax=Actinomyces vulturis TaxID=1857645 RepID=UPI00083782CB|nr:HAD family hydrolase [Actinomyces vulturis]
MTMLLASDLDGTLVFDRLVSQRDREAIARWRDAGHVFAIASGRSRGLVGYACADSDLSYDYAIASSGAAILNAQGELVDSTPMDPEVVRGAAQVFMSRQDVSMFVTTTDGDFAVHDALDYVHNPDALVINHFLPGTLDEMANHAVTALTIVTPDVVIAKDLERQVKELFPDDTDSFRSHGFLDVVAAGVHKGMGVDHVRSQCEQTGMSIDKVICVGDSWNDIPMFHMADYPVAMDGVAPDVTEAARHNSTPAVADLIDRLLSEAAL